jgi:phosphohistidine phosphatase SixA
MRLLLMRHAHTEIPKAGHDLERLLTPTAFKDAILLTDPKKVYRHESGNLSIQQTSE